MSISILQAIIELNNLVASLPQQAHYKQPQAVMLGIQALKRVKRTRDPRFPIQGQELPGETKGGKNED